MGYRSWFLLFSVVFSTLMFVQVFTVSRWRHSSLRFVFVQLEEGEMLRPSLFGSRVVTRRSFVFQVEGNFYVNESLEKLIFEELRNACRGGGLQLFA